MKCNVLIITIDSLRADRCFGIKKTAETPNIDKLIKNGLKKTLKIYGNASTGLVTN